MTYLDLGASVPLGALDDEKSRSFTVTGSILHDPRVLSPTNTLTSRPRPLSINMIRHNKCCSVFRASATTTSIWTSSLTDARWRRPWPASKGQCTLCSMVCIPRYSLPILCYKGGSLGKKFTYNKFRNRIVCLLFKLPCSTSRRGKTFECWWLNRPKCAI